MRVLSIVTAGGGQDVIRARRLACALDADVTYHVVDRAASRRQATGALRSLLRAQPWDLVYQEGSGIVGGINLIRAARSWGQPYIVSSGDPIGGFFGATKGRLWGVAFSAYEKALYRSCAGFVGWTPYLTGVALRLGAPRAVTVEGGVDLEEFRPCSAQERQTHRRELGLAPDHIVCGVVGSLNWTARSSYCYGLELVETLKRLDRRDVSILVVGDGTGRAKLEEALPPSLRTRAVFPGRLGTKDVVKAINSMDVGFVTQTLDGLGSYRLTTKLPEYLACGVPVAMSPVPGFYDYALQAGWPLPAEHPARPEFHARCADWLGALMREDVAAVGARARTAAEQRFDYAALAGRFRAFVYDVLSASDGSVRVKTAD
jgi:glycosyltransferase involved in cell wall biosynthesis